MTTQEMITNSLHNLETLRKMKESLLQSNATLGSINKVQAEITLHITHLETLQAALKAETVAVEAGV